MKATDSYKINDMTNGNPIRQIILFAIPMFIGNIFQQIYSVVDTMVAGYYLGDGAIASIGVTAALYSFIINFAMGINSGSALVLTRSIGSGNQAEVKRDITGMIVLNGMIVLILTTLTCLFMRVFLDMINTPDDIFEDAYIYMMVLCIGILATVLYNMLSGILRAFGNSRTALYFLVIASVTNGILDYVFIALFHMGVMGAALATVLAELMSGLLCLVYVMKNYAQFMPGKRDISFDKSIISELFMAGISMALMYCANDLGSIIFSGANNMLGTVYITAHTTARRIILIMMQPLATIASAYATFVGQNYGAGKFERIKDTTRKVLLLEVAGGVFAFLFIYILGEALVKLITGSSDMGVISNAVFSIRLQHAFYPALGILLCIRICLQAMGEKRAPVSASMMELSMKVAFAFLLIPRIGFVGTVITEPVIWVICSGYILAEYLKKRKDLFKEAVI